MGNWCKSVSAFANGTGGTLMLSLDDIGSDGKGSVDAVAERIKREVEPLPEFDVSMQELGNKQFLMLHILRGKEPPYYYVGDGSRIPYRREGNQSVPMENTMGAGEEPAFAKTDLQGGSMTIGDLAQKGDLAQNAPSSYDSQVTSCDFQDVSFTKLKALYRQFTSRTFRPADFQEFGLVNGGKLTNAGLLLADEALEQQAKLICARWEGTGRHATELDASDYKQYTGSLFILLQSGIAFVNHNSKIQRSSVNGVKQELPDYPRYCVAEGLVNALVHSDYEDGDGEIHIDVYDDRLEIRSTGRLPQNEALRKDADTDMDAFPQLAVLHQNPVIAKAFQRLGCMKGKGLGLKQILQTYERQHRYRQECQPRLFTRDGHCTLVLRNLNALEKRKGSKIGDQTSGKTIAKKTQANKEKVLAHLQTKGISKTSEMAEMLGLSLPRTRALLNELVGEGLIKANGSNKNRTYELKTKD